MFFVLVLCVQHSDSIYVCVYTHIHIYILFQSLSPYRLLQNTEHSSLMSASLYCILGDEALGNSSSGPEVLPLAAQAG